MAFGTGRSPTYPRDKGYAFLSLLDPSSSTLQLKPSYSESTVSVYVQASFQALRSEEWPVTLDTARESSPC